MKKTLKKLLICILIILIINNFFISNISFAADSFEDWLVDLLGSVVGLLTYPIRIVAIGCGYAIDTLTKSVAESQGAVDANGNIVEGTFINNGMITPFDIFFNKIALIDVNFFNIINDGSIISNIRNSIAGWYYVMRMIAASILLCILIYVGIRMAISTIASDKAAYKKMLVDWVCSLALIFLLQYIILFTFAVNDAFIKALSGINDGKALSDAMVNIKELAMKVFEVNSIAATIVFCMLVAQTLGLLISYFNRMLKLAFLVIIAPLITLTYSIDKMGDGKAQALGTWLKEFVYTVLLQTFHCIIYMAFVSMALAIFTKTGASESNNLAGSVLAVLCVKFTKEGEKILGKIFSFSDSTSDSSLAVGMAASAMALSKAKGIGKGTRSAVNGIKNFGGNLGQAARTARVEALAVGAMVRGARREDGSRMSFQEAKDQADTALTEKEAAKEELKNARKYGVSTKANEKDKDSDDPAKKAAYDKAKAYEDKVAAATDANKKAGMSASLAAAKARAQVAKETRSSEKSKAFAKNHRFLNGARGSINAVRSIASQSETLKMLGDMGKKTLSAGVGTFVGGAAYGATGNAFNSIALGSATYKGHQEYMKNSTKTLTSEVSNLLQGAGMKDVAEAGAHMSDIMRHSDKYEDADTEVKNLLSEIEKALEGAMGGNPVHPDLKNSIRNVVNSEIGKNPSATNDDILKQVLDDSKVRKQAGLDDVNKENAGAIAEAMGSSVGNLSDFTRNKRIYDTVKSAGDIGVSPDKFVESSLKRFEGEIPVSQYSDSPTRKEENQAIVDKARTEKLKQEEIDGIIKDAANDPELRKDIEKEMELELKALEKAKKSVEAEGGNSEVIEIIDNQMEQLERNMQNLSDQATEAYRQQLNQEFQRLLAEYKSDLELEAKREIENLMKHTMSEFKSTVSESQRFGTIGDTAQKDFDSMRDEFKTRND